MRVIMFSVKVHNCDVDEDIWLELIKIEKNSQQISWDASNKANILW